MENHRRRKEDHQNEEEESREEEEVVIIAAFSCSGRALRPQCSFLPRCSIDRPSTGCYTPSDLEHAH
jgi:hypothetical protein